LALAERLFRGRDFSGDARGTSPHRSKRIAEGDRRESLSWVSILITIEIPEETLGTGLTRHHITVHQDRLEAYATYL
jgi:hypothetical protein